MAYINFNINIIVLYNILNEALHTFNDYMFNLKQKHP